MKAKQGEWKKAAQVVSRSQAEASARSVWLAYWKKYDRQRRAAKPKR